MLCRASCLLESTSDGTDMSLSTNCNPCTTHRKHHTIDSLFFYIFFLRFTCIKLMCPPWWMHFSQEHHRWSVAGLQRCMTLPVRPHRLIWTLIAERRETEEEAFLLRKLLNYVIFLICSNFQKDGKFCLFVVLFLSVTFIFSPAVYLSAILRYFPFLFFFCYFILLLHYIY